MNTRFFLKDIFKYILSFFCILICSGEIVYSQQLPGYSYRKKITVQAGQVCSGSTQTNFPMLVNETGIYLKTVSNGGKIQNSSGWDIAFTANHTTTLDHEIEQYEGVSTGIFRAWVKIPSITNGTVLYMYYGNTSVGSNPSTTATWSNGFTNVWHFDEDPSAAAPQMYDSYAGANNGTSAGSMTSTDEVAAQIGNGLDFDGSDDQITISGTFDPPDAGTVSCWIKPDDKNGRQRVLGFHDAYEMIVKDNNPVDSYDPANNFFAAGAFGLASTNSYSYAQWKYLSMPYDFTTTNDLLLYVNGANDGFHDTNADDNPGTGTLYLGRSALAGEFYKGLLDEVRIASVVRSADWICTEYNSQNLPSSFYALDAEEPLPVELLYFTVKWKDENKNTALLEWSTASELNNNYFEIQRSVDAVNFTTLKQVQGSGNSFTQITYSQTDEDPVTNIASYYRLKQVDFNGDFSYSSITVLNAPEGIDIINIWPNPSANEFTFMITSVNADKINIEVIDNTGKKIIYLQQTITGGLNIISLDTRKLVAGYYLLRAMTESGNYKDQMQFVIKNRD